MRFSLVAFSLATAAFAAPTPNNNNAVNGLVGTRGDISSDITNIVSDTLNAAKRQTLLGDDYEIADLEGDVGDLIGNLKRGDVSGEIASVVKDVEGLIKRASISDIESEASKAEAEAKDLIAEAEAEIKAAE